MMPKIKTTSMSSKKLKPCADCIVVGGGIIGLFVARKLHQSGKSVILVEKGRVGQESSWAGGGILASLSPWCESEIIFKLLQDSQKIYPGLLAEIEAHSGIPVEWTTSGMLILSLSAAEQSLVLRWAKQKAQKIEVILGTDLPKTFSLSRAEEKKPALFLKDVMQIRNPTLLKALRVDLLRRGVKILEHERVTGFQLEKNRCLGVVTTQNTYSSGCTLVTAGAWTDMLLASVGLTLSIFPVRGQMLLFKSSQKLFHPIVVENGFYLIPRQDGHILAGSTVESVGFYKQVTEGAYQLLSENAYRLVPILKHKAKIVAQWTGLRPACRAGAPFIGVCPGVDGLLIGAGHFRNGIAMAPATAELLAAKIL